LNQRREKFLEEVQQEDAREMFENIATSTDYPEFLTLLAYAKMP
jgi:hypothetical protein